MKKVLFAVFALVATILLIQPTTASAQFLQNWYVDLDGTGSPTTEIGEALDNVGGSAIVLNLDGSFYETAVFRSTGHDFGQLFESEATPTEWTAVFTGNGTYTPGSAFTFTGGHLEMWADASLNYGTTSSGDFGAGDGTLIAAFDLLYGSGSINALGIPNGEITSAFRLQEGTMADGYMLFPDGVTDFADHQDWILGFATTNASYIANPPQLLVDAIGYDIDPAIAWKQIFVSNNGQFRVVTPEPGSMLLLGMGLVGLAGLRRKKVA